MTTRRTFLAGLMASAAIGPAQAVPAQPVAGFFKVVGRDQFGRSITEILRPGVTGMVSFSMVDRIEPSRFPLSWRAP